MPRTVFRTVAFQSTLPARGATAVPANGQLHAEISIHAPRTGSDGAAQSCVPQRKISIHAPRTGSDQGAVQKIKPLDNFNPRSPHGERQRVGTGAQSGNPISIHAPRTGSDGETRGDARPARISIHAPRTGSDPPDESWSRNQPISIHAPRTGSDPRRVVAYSDVDVFQSTLPARGATYQQTAIEKIYSISIHAPRTGSDGIVMPQGRTRGGFQSTLPARGATNLPNPAGSLSDNFNPRSPHGERPPRGTNEAAEWHFNPRSPHGERLSVSARCSQVYCISIHAPRTGSDNNILPISSLC